MPRGKCKIEKIEDVGNRKVTFLKRRTGLFKKAHELSVLCDAEVGVIIFSSSGNLFEFSSSNMTGILSRYKRHSESPSSSVSLPEAQAKQGADEVETMKDEIAKLKEEIANLEANQRRLVGKDLTGMNLNHLQKLQHLPSEDLVSVKEKQERLMYEQLEQSVQAQRTLVENRILQRQGQQAPQLLNLFPF